MIRREKIKSPASKLAGLWIACCPARCPGRMPRTAACARLLLGGSRSSRGSGGRRSRRCSSGRCGSAFGCGSRSGSGGRRSGSRGRSLLRGLFAAGGKGQDGEQGGNHGGVFHFGRSFASRLNGTLVFSRLMPGKRRAFYSGFPEKSNRSWIHAKSDGTDSAKNPSQSGRAFPERSFRGSNPVAAPSQARAPARARCHSPVVEAETPGREAAHISVNWECRTRAPWGSFRAKTPRVSSKWKRRT
jgi:hypothetical protein